MLDYHRSNIAKDKKVNGILRAIVYTHILFSLKFLFTSVE